MRSPSYPKSLSDGKDKPTLVDENKDEEMDFYKTDMAKIISVLCYITLIGWLVAMLLYGNHKSAQTRFHLRQSLGLIITAALLSFIPLIGWVLNIVVIVLWFVALFHAVQGKEYQVPVVGPLYQAHLDFIR